MELRTIIVVLVVIAAAFLIYREKTKPMKNKPEPKFVDQKLKSYLDDFLLSASERNIPIDLSKVTIKIGKPSIEGARAESVGNDITFDESEFDTFSDSHKRYLMFHEIGHNIFGYDHSTDPQSIMAGGGISAGGSLLISESKRIDDFFNLSK